MIERDAVVQLPNFEKRVWKFTRPYYAVNKNSRAAAEKIALTNTLLSKYEPVPDGSTIKTARNAYVALCEDSFFTGKCFDSDKPFILDVGHGNMREIIRSMYDPSWGYSLEVLLELAAKNYLEPYMMPRGGGRQPDIARMQHIILLATPQIEDPEQIRVLDAFARNLETRIRDCWEMYEKEEDERMLEVMWH